MKSLFTVAHITLLMERNTVGVCRRLNTAVTSRIIDAYTALLAERRIFIYSDTKTPWHVSTLPLIETQFFFF
jgi:hypothetical protein